MRATPYLLRLKEHHIYLILLAKYIGDPAPLIEGFMSTINPQEESVEYELMKDLTSEIMVRVNVSLPASYIRPRKIKTPFEELKTLTKY